MSQSLSRVLIHLVFSTQDRKPLIESAKQERMFYYLGGTLKNIECPPIKIGGMPDHVHLLFALHRTRSISKVVEEVKKESSIWAKDIFHPDFYWQSGYGAFSVSPSNVPAVVNYIENQEEHHRVKTYQDELRQTFRKHGIEWDERYVWD